MNKLILLARGVVLAITSRLRWLPPTLARFSVGWLFLVTGWGKVHNIPKVVAYFTDLGIPAPAFHAHLVAATELGCGALLLLGLLTRVASVPLIVSMTVAILTAKREELHGLDDLFAFSEYLYITLLVWLAIEGPGPLSLDRFLTRKLGLDSGTRGGAL